MADENQPLIEAPATAEERARQREKFIQPLEGIAPAPPPEEPPNE